jgi:hypothetical protein
MDQTKMFTSEEQSGSGQTNMLSLIERNQDRIKELRKLPHTFHTDPGHGWLEVEHQDLIILDIIGSISGFSYRDGEKVYLEEDQDATTYINALFTPYMERSVEDHSAFKMWRDITTESHKENTFIRNLAGYR